MNTIEKIKSLSGKYSEKFISVRRKIHEDPELSFSEYKTSGLVYNLLKKLKPDRLQIIGKTGVTAFFDHKNKSTKCVALRADLDALPILEKTGLAFSSKNNGIMHACGHDAHAAMLYGAALILSELRNELKGKVKFIFQPGEEKNPGGASILIKNKILENPKADVIFGQHIITDKPAGSLRVLPGSNDGFAG